MSRTTPLQVILIRDHNVRATEVYRDALILAFEGTLSNPQSGHSYLEDAVDLQIHVLDPPGFVRSDFEIQKLLDAARHSIVVTIDSGLVKSGTFKKHLEYLRDRLDKRYFVDVDLPTDWDDSDEQRSVVTEGDLEPGLWPIAMALLAMERGRQVLQSEINSLVPAPSGTPSADDANDEKLRFFLSHAKIDGIPLAISLIGLMRRIAKIGQQSEDRDQQFKDLEYFYDVEDIAIGTNWKNSLESNAKNSVLIVLRTEEYENRFWCCQEYLWAEEKLVPILVVDLRRQQVHGGSRLPFGPAPVVKVHDGNLIRVLLHMLATHLRVLRAESQIYTTNSTSDVPDHYVYIPRQPSEIALYGAIQKLKKQIASEASNVSAKIVYPNPKLPKVYQDAVRPILDSAGFKLELVTLDELGLP